MVLQCLGSSRLIDSSQAWSIFIRDDGSGRHLFDMDVPCPMKYRGPTARSTFATRAMCAGNFIYKLYRARAFSRLICNDFARKASEPRRAEWGGRKQRGKSLGRRYEWFISRGRLIFRPGCGGENVLWKRRSFLSRPFSISSFSSSPRFSPPPPPPLRPPSPLDLYRLTQFNRVLPRARVFVRHYSATVYRSRASRRYFLWLEFHTSRTLFPACGHHHPRRVFNYCVLEWCCLPAARYFFLPLLCASRRCSEISR